MEYSDKIRLRSQGKDSKEMSESEVKVGVQLRVFIGVTFALCETPIYLWNAVQNTVDCLYMCSPTQSV